jgi:hypothetical protein
MSLRLISLITGKIQGILPRAVPPGLRKCFRERGSLQYSLQLEQGIFCKQTGKDIGLTANPIVGAKLAQMPRPLLTQSGHASDQSIVDEPCIRRVCNFTVLPASSTKLLQAEIDLALGVTYRSQMTE